MGHMEAEEQHDSCAVVLYPSLIFGHIQPPTSETCHFCESFSYVLRGGWSSWALLTNSAQEVAGKDFQQRAFVHTNPLPPWLSFVSQKHHKMVATIPQYSFACRDTCVPFK